MHTQIVLEWRPGDLPTHLRLDARRQTIALGERSVENRDLDLALRLEEIRIEFQEEIMPQASEAITSIVTVSTVVRRKVIASAFGLLLMSLT